LTTYRKLLLAEHHIAYFEYGYAVVEALVMGKVILIGEALGLGRRFDEHPLAVSTLWKTLVYGSFVAIFAVLERFVGALVHGKSLASAIPQLAGNQGYELLARVIVTLVALVPLIAFLEIGRVLGEGKLNHLFFRRRLPSKS
jgi:hypothetical protein